MTRRTCTGCGVEKRLGDFYRHPRGKDGYGSRCKVCKRAAVAENREVKREVIREQQRRRYATDAEYRARVLARVREYVKTPQGRESRRITQRAYRAFRRATETTTHDRPVHRTRTPVAVLAPSTGRNYGGPSQGAGGSIGGTAP